jgi:hypothetical protein
MTAIVQVAVDPTSAVASGTPLAMGSNATAGNHMVVVVFHSYGGCSPSLADSQGNTYTKHVNNGNTGGGGVNFHCWSAPIGSSAALSVTPTFACGSRTMLVAYEVSGLITPGDPFDVYTNSTNASNPVVAGTLTTTTNGAFVAAMFSSTGGGTFTPGTGYTERGDNGNGYMAMDTIQVSAGSITPDATAGSSPSTVHGYSVAFKSAGGGGGGSIAAISVGYHLRGMR